MLGNMTVDKSFDREHLAFELGAPPLQLFVCQDQMPYAVRKRLHRPASSGVRTNVGMYAGAANLLESGLAQYVWACDAENSPEGSGQHAKGDSTSASGATLSQGSVEVATKLIRLVANLVRLVLPPAALCSCDPLHRFGRAYKRDHRHVNTFCRLP